MKTRDLVIIKNTNSSLDGLPGKLMGKSISGLVTFWIVELIGGPFVINDEEWLAVTLPGSCLELDTCKTDCFWCKTYEVKE